MPIGADPVTPPVLVYDGSCPLCRGGVTWIGRRMPRGAIEFLPCQAAERRARFPWMDEGTCMAAMQLVLPDGRVFGGDAAIPEILARLPRWRWLGALLRVPGAAGARPAVYHFIARNRYRISRALPRR